MERVAGMKCPLCGVNETELIFREDNAEFCNNAITFPLTINMCLSCGFVFQSSAYGNAAYSAVLDTVYSDFTKSENFPFPLRSTENVRTLEMILKHCGDKPNLNILEIGSNRGDMLWLLKERLESPNIIGIDPQVHDTARVPTIRDFFRPGLFSNKFDLVLMQHVLEHIMYPASIMQNVDGLLTPEGILYVEVPDVVNALEYRLGDFALEHVNYFSASTLQRAIPNRGIVEYDRTSFLRTVSRRGAPALQKEELRIDGFKEMAASYQESKRKLVDEICSHAGTQGKIVFYGVSFYFKLLFKAVRESMMPENCFYLDDNFTGSVELTYGLRRAKPVPQGSMVVLCSNNFCVQEEMLSRLRAENVRDVRVVRPWSSCFEL